MTPEKVLFRTNDYIERLIDIIPKSEKQEKSKRENLDFALSIKSAIEKQIPRKPKVSFQLGFYWCPDCECAIKMKIEKSKKNISYCPFCGQALAWG